LVVNDDPLILRHACDIPEGAGFHFHQAGTGEEAKALLGDDADGVTLMFSDVAMPGDSDRFARTHYVAEYWPWIEIVLTSGNVTPCPGDMLDKATCIGKPFDDRMLQQHLTEKLPDNKRLEQLKRAV
jgi:CheY-like chemotaxis protein